MNLKRRKIIAAQDNNYKDNGGYAEYTSETKDLYNSIVALYEKSCKVLSESAGPSVKLGEALEAIYDLFPRYGLDEDEDIEGACGKKSVKGAEDDTYNVVLEEEYGPYTGSKVLHRGLDKASAKSAQRHYSKNAPMNQSYYTMNDEELTIAEGRKRSICSAKELSDDELDLVYEIADRYCGSSPVSGDWDTETQHEQNAIAEELDVSLDEAKQIMQEYLGFDDAFFSSTAITCSYDDFDDYVEPENEGAVSLAYDGEYMRSFGPSLLQELIEARLSGPVSVYSVEIGNNLTTVYFEITDMDDYSIEEAEYDIERAVDDIVNYGEEPEDGSSLDDAMYMDMGYNQYS